MPGQQWVGEKKTLYNSKVEKNKNDMTQKVKRKDENGEKKIPVQIYWDMHVRV